MELHSHRIRSAIVITAASMLALGGSLVSAAEGATNMASAPILLSDAELGQLPDLVYRDHSDRYGGDVVEPTTHSVTVYVKDTSITTGRSVDPPQARADVQTLPDKTAKLYKSLGASRSTAANRSWTVRFVTVGRSLADLAAVQTTVTGKEPLATALGANQIRMQAVNPATNTLDIGVASVTPELTAAATATYGAAVRLVETPAFQLDSSRLLDTTPYYGGDRIISAGSGVKVSCTAGFDYISGSYSYHQWLTAGHCIAANNSNQTGGTGWQQGYYDSNGNRVTNNLYPGLYNGWSISGNQNPDAGLITQFYTNQNILGDPVWVNSTPNVPMGLGNNSVGYPVCADGSFTGENCSAVVSYYNASICVAWSGSSCTYWVTNQAVAQSTRGQSLSQNGDSGGPVISFNNGLLVNGIIVGDGANTPGGSGGVWLTYTPIEEVIHLIGGGPVLH